MGKRLDVQDMPGGAQMWAPVLSQRKGGIDGGRLRWIVVAVCLMCAGCTPEVPDVNALTEISKMVARCEVSGAETFMVDLDEWDKESGVTHSWCWRIRASLRDWREKQGDDWGFLNNPASEGPLPSLEGFHVLGVRLWYEDGSKESRVVVVDTDSGRVGSGDGRSRYGYLNSEGEFGDVSQEVVAEVEALTMGLVSGWVPLPGWTGEEPWPTNGAGWVPRDGLGWQLTICTKDYSLYRFVGEDAAPEGLLDYVDMLWGLGG